MPYAIKVKHESEKRWSFMNSNGNTTYLRIHAAQFANKEKVEQLAQEIREDNPGFEVKVVDF